MVPLQTRRARAASALQRGARAGQLTGHSHGGSQVQYILVHNQTKQLHVQLHDLHVQCCRFRYRRILIILLIQVLHSLCTWKMLVVIQTFFYFKKQIIKAICIYQKTSSMSNKFSSIHLLYCTVNHYSIKILIRISKTWNWGSGLRHHNLPRSASKWVRLAKIIRFRAATMLMQLENKKYDAAWTFFSEEILCR